MTPRTSRLLAVVRAQPVLAGFCYTQFADTYQEANGLLHADRTPKIPLDQIAVATRGPLDDDELHEEERALQERLMRELGATQAARSAIVAQLQSA